MNLLSGINYNNQGISSVLSSWIDSKPVPQVIDSFTYDLYENGNNPFRETINADSIGNSTLKTATKVGAETFSAFANPYYLVHKIIHIPAYYKNAVELYDNYKN